MLRFVRLTGLWSRLSPSTFCFSFSSQTMSRPWKRALPALPLNIFGHPNARISLPRRPVLLCVDLREVPNILEELQELPEAHQLTQNNLPNLSAEEEL